MDLKRQENQLQREVQQRKEEILQIKDNTASLSNPRKREKFAREVHYFKKPHERIFIISNE